MSTRLATTLCIGLLTALAAVVPAGATTGVGDQFPVRVTLTDKGVVFSDKKLHPTTQTTLAVTVVNRSSQRRWFKLGARKTRALQRGGVENFYYDFHGPGVVRWSSGAAGGTTFRGSFRVKLALGVGYG